MERRTLLQAVIATTAIAASPLRAMAQAVPAAPAPKRTQAPIRKMSMKLHAITFDCANPQALAAWWSKALGIAIGNDYGEIVSLAETPGTPMLLFQKIADVPTQRNRVHPDFSTPDLDGETERLVAIGATVVEKFNLPQVRYTTLTDLDGNKFDLAAE